MCARSHRSQRRRGTRPTALIGSVGSRRRFEVASIRRRLVAWLVDLVVLGFLAVGAAIVQELLSEFEWARAVWESRVARAVMLRSAGRVEVLRRSRRASSVMGFAGAVLSRNFRSVG